MKTESHDEFMGFELRQIPQHDDDCARYGYEVKLPIDGQWYEIDSYTLRWNRQDALDGLVNVLRRVMDQKMESAMKVIRRLERERDEAQIECLEQARLLGMSSEREAKLISERNEAREDADHWKSEYEIVVARLCGVKHERDNGIIFEHEIIPKLERERDQARNENLGWENKWKCAIEMAARAELEIEKK